MIPFFAENFFFFRFTLLFFFFSSFLLFCFPFFLFLFFSSLQEPPDRSVFVFICLRVTVRTGTTWVIIAEIGDKIIIGNLKRITRRRIENYLIKEINAINMISLVVYIMQIVMRLSVYLLTTQD